MASENNPFEIQYVRANSTRSMSVVSPTPLSDEVDPMYLMLSQVFQNMLKKPEPDDDPDASQVAGVDNEIKRTIAAAMAQRVMGFGMLHTVSIYMTLCK